MSPRPVRLGLTGGIGSGKSTVGQMLVQCGAALIDADAMARNVTAAGGAAMVSIAREFGPSFVKSDGSLDRDRMRERAFEDPQAKRQLEAIVQPLVGQAIDRAAQQATAAGHRLLVYDIPLLVESGRWRSQVDRVLVVDCLTETQIARVQARNHLDRPAIEAIIHAQAPRATRLAAADVVVFNEGLDLAGLRRLVTDFAQALGL